MLKSLVIVCIYVTICFKRQVHYNQVLSDRHQRSTLLSYLTNHKRSPVSF